MFCNKCGSNCPDGVAFCTNCGAPLNTQPVQPTFTESADVAPVSQQSVQPIYQQAAQPENVSESSVPGYGLGLASFIVGLASLITGSIIGGIIGLILASNAKKEAEAVGKTLKFARTGKKLSIAAIIVSAVLIVLLIIFYIVYFVFMFGFLGMQTGSYYF
ncbi:MAG: zinc ribbon domain-containing protein [Ruminococcaceae bacterium]|nr:zinc ribbon domain-containing protein [Oscillospiraceae bacterium]